MSFAGNARIMKPARGGISIENLGGLMTASCVTNGWRTNIAFIENQGISAFETDQKKREQLLSETLTEFNEGRSKSYYCIVAMVMDTQEIADAIAQARNISAGADIKTKTKSKALHAILDRIAEDRKYILKLRKKSNA